MQKGTINRVVSLILSIIMISTTVVLVGCASDEYNGTYLCDRTIVEYAEKVFVADKTGVWYANQGGDNKIVVYGDSPATSMAVSENYILFSTYSESTDENNAYEQNHFAIRCVNLSDSSEVFTIDTYTMAKPVCIVDEVLYYIDAKDEPNQDELMPMTWLKSYDMATGEVLTLAEDAQEAVCMGSEIIYKNTGLAAESADMQLHCYNVDDESITDVSDVSVTGVKVFDNNLYFSSISYEESGETVIAIYRYDNTARECVEVAKCDADMLLDFNANDAIMCSVDYATEEPSYEYFVADFASGDTYAVSNLPQKDFTAAFCDDDAVFVARDDLGVYYYDNETVNYVDCPLENSMDYNYHLGAFYYENDEGNVLCTPWSYSEDKIKPEPTKPTEPVVDYSSYLGHWSYTNDAGGVVWLDFTGFDENNASFSIGKARPNAVQLATTEIITAPVEDDLIEFTYSDSFGNYGESTISLDGDTIHLVAQPYEFSQYFGIDCDVTLTKQ